VVFVSVVSWRCIFFFSSRRRHTRSKRDWSSDVCSSDLHFVLFDVTGQLQFWHLHLPGAAVQATAGFNQAIEFRRPLRELFGGVKIGRASCRERGEISVVAGSVKNKRHRQWTVATDDTHA